MSPLSEELMSILFKIQGYQARKVSLNKKNNSIEIYCEPIKQLHHSSCLFTHTNYDSTVQKIYIGSILFRPVFAFVRVYRIKCELCGILTKRQTISEGKRRYSKAASGLVIEYTKHLDNNSVSSLLGLSKSTVYRIDVETLFSLQEPYKKAIPLPSVLSVDEVSYKKRHHYATVLTSYDTSKVLWLEKGRKSVDLKRAYKVIGKDLSKIKTVGMDFWAAYERATRIKLPHAKIVYDRFHISRILNRKVEDERRAYQNSLPDDQKKNIKKNYRWLILRRHNNMNDEHKNHLQQLKDTNEPLYELYLLKESFLDIFKTDKTVLEAYYDMMSWIETVSVSNFKKLKSFSKTLLKRMDTILNWFENTISNGKAEGVNNVIKSVLKRAYGYKNFEYFRLKVLQKCGTLMDYATHTF